MELDEGFAGNDGEWNQGEAFLGKSYGERVDLFLLEEEMASAIGVVVAIVGELIGVDMGAEENNTFILEDLDIRTSE